MRSELTNLERIDAYLSGSFSESEKLAFESEMASDPNLEAMVSQQKDLIRAVNRNALRAEINAVAAAGGGGAGSAGISKVILGVTGAVTVGLTAAGIWYFTSTGKEENANTAETKLEVSSNPIVDATSITDSVFLPEKDIVMVEQPETIFSTVNHYDDTEEDRLNVTVNFEPMQRNTSGVAETTTEPANTNTVAHHETVNEVHESAHAAVEGSAVESRAKRALFPGGNGALKNFIDRNLHYPRTAKNKGISSVVRVDFHVDFAGNITEIDAECIKMMDKEGIPFTDMKRFMNKKIEGLFIGNATHVLRTMPRWNAARDRDGNPVLSAQRMYFNFDLKKGCSVYQLNDEVPVRSIESFIQD